MFKRILKWIGIVLGGLIGLLAIAVLVLVIISNNRINARYQIQPDNITIPTDAEAIARGKHWVEALCIGCHQANLAGGPFMRAPFASIDAANLTPGKGGVGAKFTDADWVRLLRHGVDEEGRPVIVMPASDFTHFSDQDLGDIIAYLKTLPPVDNETQDPEFNILGRVMLAAGVFGPDIIPAEVINHNERPASYPAAGATPAYGEYLVNVSGCRVCHGKQLAGGKSPDPSAKAAPNLTPGGELVAWKDTDFITAIRTGVTLSGHQLDPKEMPWEHFKNYSDDELKAIFLYLQSLPKLQTVIP